MRLLAFYTEHLWVKVLTALSAVFILVMGTMITLNLRAENAMVRAQIKHQGEILAESVEGGMDDALAVGNNEAVQLQFQRLKEKLPDIDVFVFDFEQVISFATEPDVAGKPIEAFTKEEGAIQAVARMLQSGQAPTEPFEEWINGTPYMTIFRPVLNEARCFHCHGSSRKVLGGALIRASAGGALGAISAARNRSIVIGAVSLGIIILLIYVLFDRLVNRQVQVLMDATRRIEKGDFTYRCEVKGRDEMSHVGARLNVMCDNLSNMFKDIASGSETVASSSTEMSAISHQMSTTAEQASGKSNTVAAAMEQASSGISTVATAAEEMTATIDEIARNAEKARSITEGAVSEAQSASGKIDELGKAAQEIGEVTETITAVSEQTNLLALNATIEAARAGEAGKGFAVVANEIKALAKQTAGATEEIKKKIEGVQDSTAGTVSKIEQISKVITEVNEIVSVIASAVEEQSVTTKEIASNVAESSNVVGEVTKDLSDVNQAASEMSDSSSQVNNSAQELSKLAEQLKEMVGKFTV
jgi:methyl-accepting chemotaxis protein